MTAAGPMPGRGATLHRVRELLVRLGRIRAFLVLWAGQTVSQFGTALTDFVVGIWIYQLTGSATSFALSLVCGRLPGILLAPLAGVLVDRWRAKTAIFLSDLLPAAGTVGLALLFLWGEAEVVHIYLALALRSAASALGYPAFAAAVASMVGERHLARANGLVWTGLGVCAIGVPLLATVLIDRVPVHGVLWINVATFAFALATIALIRIPQPAAAPTRSAGVRALVREGMEGWSFIFSSPGLRGLLILFMASNLALGVVHALLTPMLLDIGSAQTVAWVRTASGVGLLAGSIVFTLFGGARRTVDVIIWVWLIDGICSVLIGMRSDLFLIGAGIVASSLVGPAFAACEQAIWQSRTPPDMRGRVFSIRLMLSSGSLPVAFLGAGLLVDSVLDPFLAGGGIWGTAVAGLLGSGSGRGAGLLFTLTGVLLIMGWVRYASTLRRLLEEGGETTEALPAPATEPAPGPQPASC